jgi:hypothetical protein
MEVIQMSSTSDYDNYSGDVNLEYGGMFVDLDDWQYKYADVLRITDLDSGCGFTGAVMIEHLTALVPEKRDKMQSCLSVCGWDKGRLPGRTSKDRKMAMIEAIMAYGYYDPAQDFTGFHRTIIQCNALSGDDDYDSWNSPMEYDGWKADYRLGENETLLEWLENDGWLNDF